MKELQDAARTAGLRDADLLKIAKPDLAPADAVADLQRRFPGAFEPTFDARTASKEERVTWLARYRAEQITKDYQATNDVAFARAEARHAGKTK